MAIIRVGRIVSSCHAHDADEQRDGLVYHDD
jgi:hypothetical protein